MMQFGTVAALIHIPQSQVPCGQPLPYKTELHLCLPFPIVKRKILKRFKATPMNPADILVSQIIVNLFMTVVGMVLLLILGKLVFDIQFMGKVFPMVVAFFISTLSIFSIGFVIASLAPGMKSASAIANIVYFPMLFLTGATFPLELMPKTMLKISKFLPLTYSVEFMKGIWLGGKFSDYTADILLLVAVFVVCVAISIFSFRWEY